MSAAPLVLLAAGGTGGHLFPAQALADALQKRGAVVELATDARAAHFKFRAIGPLQCRQNEPASQRLSCDAAVAAALGISGHRS